MPPWARVSAAAPPAGPPPMTATRRLRLASLGLALDAVTLRDVRRWERERDDGTLETKVIWSVGDWRSPVKDLSANVAIEKLRDFSEVCCSLFLQL